MSEINLRPLFVYSLFSILGIIMESYVQFKYELYFRSFCALLLLSVLFFVLSIYMNPNMLDSYSETTPIKVFMMAIILTIPVGFILHMSTSDGNTFPALYSTFLIIFYLIAFLTIISIIGLIYLIASGCESCRH